MYTNDYTQNLQLTTSWLKSQNLPIIPVAPPQSALDHPSRNKDGSIKRDKHGQPIPAFTGKNPSHIDKDDIPRLVRHGEYTSQLPTAQDEQTWFANPKNGIGTLGGWNGWNFLDFDLKNFDGDKEACKAAAFEIAAKYQQLSGKEAFLQESHSGGWHVGVRIRQKPNFTNFALTPGGKHIGEAQGEGRFIVLAPTIGISGNPYVILQWGDPTGEVESLESIGIYSTKKIIEQTPQVRHLSAGSGSSIPLELLGTETSRQILNGADPANDRSASLTTALKEWYGWQNWAQQNGIAISSTPEDLAHYAGQQLGIDSDRINRIINTIDVISCTPAASQKGEENCWKKIYRLDKATFEQKCPAHIKAEISAEWNKKLQPVTQVSASTTVCEATTGRTVDSYPDQKAPNGKVVSGNFRSKSGGSGGSGGSSIGDDNAHKLVKDLLDKGLPDDQFHAALIDLAKVTGYSAYELGKLAKKIEAADIESDQLEDTKKEVDSLLAFGSKEFEIEKVFPAPLTKALLTKCESDRLDPVMAYGFLLSAITPCLGANVAIALKDSWKEYPNLWLLMVASPSIGKSQVSHTIFGHLQKSEFEREDLIKKMKKELEEKTEAWHKLSGDQQEQLKDTDQNPAVFAANIPKPQTRYVEGGSPEGLFRRLSENIAGTGILFNFDEATRFLELDQYKNGGGDTKQKFMESWGKPLTTTIHRVDEKNSCRLRNQLFTVVGGIQPGVLNKFAGDLDDVDGMRTRFLFCVPKTHPKFSIWSHKKVDVEAALSFLYERLERLPQQMRDALNLDESDENGNPTAVVLPLCSKAEELYIKSWEAIRSQITQLEHESPALSAYLGKMLSQIGRLALAFHCINCVYDPAESLTEISEKAMESALYAAKYHISEYKLILSRLDSNNLPAEIAKIIEFGKRKSGQEIKPATIQSSVFRRQERKPSLAKIREWLKQIADWGHATLVDTGSKMRIIFNQVQEAVKDVINKTELRQNYDKPLEAETPTEYTTDSFVEEENKTLRHTPPSSSTTPESTATVEPEADTTDSNDSQHLELEQQEPSSYIEEMSYSSECEVENGCDVDTEAVSADEKMSENCLNLSENYDTDDDDDPDDDPPTGKLVMSSEWEEIMDSDDLTPLGDYVPTQPATMTSDQAPFKWKGQIIWHMWSIFEIQKIDDCGSDTSDVPIRLKIVPLNRLIHESAKKIKAFGKALVAKTAELQKDCGYKLQPIEIQALKYEGSDYWLCGYWIGAGYEVDKLVDEVRHWTVIDPDGDMCHFEGRIRPSSVVF